MFTQAAVRKDSKFDVQGNMDKGKGWNHSAKISRWMITYFDCFHNMCGGFDEHKTLTNRVGAKLKI